MYKLEAELVPSPLWYFNLREILTQSSWDKVRKLSYQKANYHCEICGGKGLKHPVECHEIWHYDDNVNLQTLRGTVALCPSCHQVKHFGLAQIRENFDDVIKHFIKVNKASREEATEYFAQQMKLFQNRSGKEWAIELAWLNIQEDIVFKKKYEWIREHI